MCISMHNFAAILLGKKTFNYLDFSLTELALILTSPDNQHSTECAYTVFKL